MPKIRTVFRPWEDLEVSDADAASMERMGLLSPTGSVEPRPAAEPAAVAAAEPAPVDQPPAPKNSRTAKTTTTAPAEEVNTDGSSEEGGQETGTQEG